MKRLFISIILCGTLNLLLGTVWAQGGASDDQIYAYPEPAVTQVATNYELIGDRTYRRVLEAAEIYDTPNGQVIETLDEGYNYVTVWQFQDDWAQIGVDRWIQTEKLSNVVYPSGFAGVLLPEGGLPYTAAWMLVNLRASTAPGLAPSDENPLLNRYTKINIYASVEVDGWRWYQVGVNQWIKQTNVAKILPVTRPEGVTTHRWVSIDLYEQVLIAYEGDRAVFATLVSSGLPQWATNEGVFNIWLPLERTDMSGSEGQSDFYYLEEVPWTMYFDGAIALHGTYWHNSFGFRHSHGCVNLSITDANWLYNFLSPEWNGETGASVYVYSSGEYQ